MKEIIKKVQKIGKEVMNELGTYYEEKVYEEAFMHELRLRKIPYEREECRNNLQRIFNWYKAS